MTASSNPISLVTMPVPLTPRARLIHPPLPLLCWVLIIAGPPGPVNERAVRLEPSLRHRKGRSLDRVRDTKDGLVEPEEKKHLKACTPINPLK